MGITLGEQVATSLASLRAGRAALDDLAANPSLLAEADAAIAGGGADAVTALVRADTAGASTLRTAWQGADELRRELPALAARLDGEDRAAATLAAAHADAAADLLDVHVFGGGRHLGGGELHATAGAQFDRAIAQLDAIHVEAPRAVRAWEQRWLDGR